MSRLRLDRAMEETHAFIEQQALPASMSQQEALDYYEDIIDFCRTWVRDIKADMKASEKEPG